MNRFRSLDGWRAVSIALVLADHTVSMPGFPAALHNELIQWVPGNLGVRFFFTISGFLITWLMLQEESKHGTVSLKNFYIRRCCRIWPVYFIFVGIVLLFQISGLNFESPDAWRGVFTFTRNFYDPITGNSGDFLTAHLWSLSIEEQFYLFWPVAFCIANKRARIAILATSIILGMSFRVAGLFGLFAEHQRYLMQEYSTLNYLDTLAWGCLAAINSAKVEPFFKKYSAAIFPVCAAMVLIPYIAQIGKGIQGIGFTGLLLHSVFCPEQYRVLNWKWISRLGVLSYSIYIWQELVWYFWKWPHVWYLWIPASILIAAVSYQFIEKPLFGLRERFRGATKLSIVDSKLTGNQQSL